MSRQYKYITWANQRRADKESKRWRNVQRSRNKLRNFKILSVLNQNELLHPKMNDEELKQTKKRDITLPKNCKFVEDGEELIQIINYLKGLADDSNSLIDSVFFDMADVNDIDSAAINIILTLTHYLNRKGVYVEGNLPKQEPARGKVMKSGFLKMVRTSLKSPDTDDCIFIHRGDDQTNQDFADEIEEICFRLLGIRQSYQPLYNTLGEIMANSVDHANKEDENKNWFMSVHYESDRAVIQMADIGSGILKTLNLLFEQEVIRSLSLQKPHITLKRLFEGKYQSSTREPNRNNGLPDMLNRFNKKYIDNVVVITNNAVYDFSNSLSRTLNNSFPGTFYSIRIDKNNIEKWQNRLNS